MKPVHGRVIDPRLASRVLIGFDRVADMLDSLSEASGSHPPYDLEKVGDNGFVLTLAVAGYSPDEIEIETADGVLSVTGSKEKAAEGDDVPKREFIHRGIALRSFKRSFRLADHVEVRSAEMKDGMLSVTLERVLPEAMKPRRIEIVTGGRAAADVPAPAEAEAA